VARIRNETFTADKWEFVALQILTFVAILIMAPLLYYVFQAVSTRRQSPNAYLKFIALSLGYWYLLFTLLILLIIAVGVILALVLMGLGQLAAVDGLTLGLQALALASYVISAVGVFALMNRDFWQLGWRPVALITAGYIAVSHGILLPGLTYAARAIDLTGLVRDLFG
jgi:hypothetical protein